MSISGKHIAYGAWGDPMTGVLYCKSFTCFILEKQSLCLLKKLQSAVLNNLFINQPIDWGVV